MKEQREFNGKKDSFLANSARIAGHLHTTTTKNKIKSRHRIYTFDKAELKMDHSLKFKPQNIKLLEDNRRENQPSLKRLRTI